jgi:hypothetical protein
LPHTRFVEEVSVQFRLDYLSCVLTVLSTILVGRRCWEGWILAAVNSAVVCVIGFRTSQFGFIPANVFCIALYAVNLRSWRKPQTQ